ncbi:uncharacterized protein IWZ02DRAFT_284616 [Phyllosticta citriasiana]|uniref:uncharacterized protein n=1 Tax=Phyllosticta citriasiana TaxID=595635 RepID=UPI0030FD86F8
MPSFARRLRIITQLLMPCDPTTTTGFMLVVRCCIRHWPQCRIPQSRKLPGIPQKPRNPPWPPPGQSPLVAGLRWPQASCLAAPGTVPYHPTTCSRTLPDGTVVLLSRRHAIEPWTGWPFVKSPPIFASIPGRKIPLFNSSPNPGTSPPPPRSHAPSQQTLREADVVVAGCTAHSCTHHTYSRIHAASAATLNIRRTPVSEANHHLYLLCIGRPSPLFFAFPGTAKRL